MLDKKLGQVCCAAAKAGGTQLLQFRERFAVREKAPKDLVTDADIASQRAIFALIHREFPDHNFVGEEQIDDEQKQNTGSEFRWIVDPLDGTINYVHGLQSYSVSVALEQQGQLIVGAVYDPVLDELFYASMDQPATLNGEPIQPSSRESVADSLVVISLPASAQRHDESTTRMLNILESARSIRRLGSAALNLCYVAAGRVDAYVATSVNAWDVAAGTVILRQAGATIRHLADRELDLEDPQLIATSTPQLWQQLFEVCRVE